MQYSQSNGTDVRAGCNKIIMFLTDGGTEKPEELFQQYNANKSVREFAAIFCYSSLCQTEVTK